MAQMKENRHRIREFEALRAVITTGTTIGAARRLGVSQPAISRSLSQLEDRLGRSLFLRTSGRIEPTAEALRLNATLDPLFETLSRIDGKDWAKPENETLSLAVPPSMAHSFVLPRLPSYLKQDPTRRIKLEIQPTEQIVAGIVDLSFDLGLTSAMIQREGVKLAPWRRSQIVCVLPENHPLCEKDKIEVQDLDGVDIVEFVRRLGTRALTEQYFARAGVKPNIIAECATNMAALELARAGIGVTVMNPFPLLTGKDHRDGIVIRPFEVHIEYRTSFVLPTNHPPSAQARAFMRHLKLTTPADDFSESM